MNLRTLNSDLKKIFKDDNFNTVTKLSFESKDFIERKINHFDSGFWSTVPFAMSGKNNLFSLRLLPNTSIEKMPIVASSKILKHNCITYSPNLALFLISNEVNLLRKATLLKYYKGYINDGLFDSFADEFFNYTGEFHSFDFLKNYINSENFKNYEKKLDGDNNFTKIYIDIISYYHNTPEFHETVGLFELLDKKRGSEVENYYNSFSNKKLLSLKELNDYGVWNTMAYNALVQSYFRFAYVEDFNLKFKFSWYSFIQPHGFDAVDIAFKTLPNLHSSAQRSSSCLSSVIDVLNSSEMKEFPDKVLRHPLLYAAESIYRSKNKYVGEGHVLAAAVLDEQYNDPKGAWNSLVTASYWCGQNAGRANIPAWEAAIYLSEKHGWKEINEILVDQLAFYNHYKDKV